MLKARVTPERLFFSENFISTNINPPIVSWKNGQHQTPDTPPQLQTLRKKRLWTHQETMAMRRCRNRSNDLIHGGRWWWWWLTLNVTFDLTFIYLWC